MACVYKRRTISQAISDSDKKSLMPGESLISLRLTTDQWEISCKEGVGDRDGVERVSVNQGSGESPHDIEGRGIRLEVGRHVGRSPGGREDVDNSEERVGYEEETVYFDVEENHQQYRSRD